MATPLREKNDIKIFILFLLRHIQRPLDFPCINEIVVQDGIVGYFDFAECFAELLETGNIAELREESGSKYQITPQGIHVADNLQSDLLPQIREKSLQSALRLLSFRERGSKLVCETKPLPDGSYQVLCGISEPGVDLLRVEIRVENRQLAERMKYHFHERPEQLYRGILALLNGEMSYLMD